MDKLRAAIIGCGNFARGQNIPNALRSERIEIAWLCDPSPEALEKAAALAGREVMRSRFAAEVLDDDTVDLAICAVPHAEHEPTVVAAAEAGKHIFTEKPMAITMEECYSIRRAVKRAGIKLCVDYNRAFAPAMQDFKAAYLAHRANPRQAPGAMEVLPAEPALPEAESSTLIIRVQDEMSSYGPVHLDWHTGRGEILGETCHWMELVCWLFEETPCSVYASGTSRTNHTVILDFISGRQAIIIFAANGTFRFPKELYEIADHAAFFRNVCFAENQVYGVAEVEERKIYPFTYDEKLQFEPREGHEGHVAALNARADHFAKTGEWLNIGYDKGHFNLLDSFARAILEDQPAPVDDRAGARATYLSLRAIDSIRLGHPVPVNTEDWDQYIW
ncbi:MAG: Gfo/Idh/MocA family oxidoreductase [candidate division WS1 bacterium]|jgi:predicted dehydrogenase|nr:Gfo/Idh/MocA family oxidoreductase [candidate division WS1 bacterium]